MDLTTQDQQARRIEQLERDNHEMRRIIERLTARMERLETRFVLPPMTFTDTKRPDPLGR